jgi:transposase
MEQLDYDLLFRWFVEFGIDDSAWDHSTFFKNRDRPLDGNIAAKFLAAVLVQPRVKRLLSTEHFSVDGSLIEAWAFDEELQAQEPVPGRGPEERLGRASLRWRAQCGDELPG